MSREKQNAEIYKPMCEELFNNIEKQYQELAKVKAESEQIEEMARDLCGIECKGMKCDTCDGYGCEYRMQAEALYNAGYRKQSEGGWEHINGNEHICKKCSATYFGFVDDFNFCPHCGAKMKGGAE